MVRKRFRHTTVDVIPKGLRFFSGESKVKPKKIKAIVQDFCQDRQNRLDNLILQQVKDYPDLNESRPESFPLVRAVDFEGNPIDLVKWLNRVYSGDLFPDNNLIDRKLSPVDYDNIC